MLGVGRTYLVYTYIYIGAVKLFLSLVNNIPYAESRPILLRVSPQLSHTMSGRIWARSNPSAVRTTPVRRHSARSVFRRRQKSASAAGQPGLTPTCTCSSPNRFTAVVARADTRVARLFPRDIFIDRHREFRRRRPPSHAVTVSHY